MFITCLYGMRTLSNPRIHDQAKSLKALGLICFLSLLPSCAPRQTKMQITSQKTSGILLTDEEIARLHDIYFPEDARPEKLAGQPGQTILGFRSKLDRKDLIEAYKAHMEYSGWHLVSLFSGQESCLIFEKPTKQCIVTLSQEETAIRVVLFIGPKLVNPT